MRGYVKQLTWLRGIAALLVIVSHAIRATEQPYVAGEIVNRNYLLSFFDMGAYAVALFFALSGATLVISHREQFDLQSTLRFYGKRFFRIYPVFIVAFFVYVVLNLWLSDVYGPLRGVWIESHLTQLSGWDYARILLFVQDLTGNPYLINGAFWSLPVEFRYYLIFPLAMIAFAAWGWRGIALVAVLTYLARYAIDWPEGAIEKFFMLSSAFFGGMLAALMPLKTKIRFPLLWLGLAYVWALVAWRYGWWSSMLYIHAVCAVISVFVLLNMGELKLPAFMQSTLSWLGNISYSLYIWHQVFVVFAVLVFLKIGIAVQDRAMFTLIFVTALSLPIAYLSYRFIEKPGVQLGRRLLDKSIK
jgi:peptidoglycan/LPS O-acetylase OafA/YrhL